MSIPGRCQRRIQRQARRFSRVIVNIITRQQRAARAAEVWRWHYGDDVVRLPDGRSPLEVYRDLLGLGANPEPERVEAVIGNDEWTSCTCNECGKAVDAVVRIGDEPGPDSQTTFLCRGCAARAVSVLSDTADEMTA